MARRRRGKAVIGRSRSGHSPVPAIGLLLAAGAAAGVLYNVLSPRGVFHPAPVTTVKPAKIAPASGTVPRGPGPKETVTPPPSPVVKIVDLGAVKVIVEQGSAVVVDARSAQSYGFGHMPGAVSIPASGLPGSFEAKKHLVPPSVRVLVYCTSASCDEAGKLLEVLKERGYTRLLHYANGWNEWELAGLPFEKGAAGESSP